MNPTAVLRTWSFLWNHPIASRNRVAAFGRWLRWQVGARVLEGQAVVPFVEGSRLLVRRGMTGATGNIYTGLHEFEDMAFTLHLLRPGDLFVDVGANVGVYTVLAGAVAGARCVAVEPIPSTFADLAANLRLNDLESRVRALLVGIGASPGHMTFTANLDTVNHVLADSESAAESIQVEVTTLDEVLRNDEPTFLKVDVEGFETKVFEGAAETLAKPSLLALIVELNGSGNRDGLDESALARRFEQFGFRPFAYAPFERRLEQLSSDARRGNNTLFIRDDARAADRLASAKSISILGVAV
jgi:FkbM family methyltransferase